MALTVRVMKCTGSSSLVRYASVIGPPIIMLFSSSLGALIGTVVMENHIMFVVLVSFGIVALLFLVCNELLIEAKHSQVPTVSFWCSSCSFAPVYVYVYVCGWVFVFGE